MGQLASGVAPSLSTSRLSAMSDPRQYRSADFDAVSHRVILKRLILENHWTRGAEIGVKRGATFIHLLKHCPNLSLIGVDIWPPVMAQMEQHLRAMVADRYAD